MKEHLSKKEKEAVKKIEDWGIEIIDYNGDRNSSIFKCFCGNIFTTSSNNLLRKTHLSCGCNKSSKRKFSTNSFQKIILDPLDITILSEYKNIETVCNFRCHCGKSFQAKPLVFLYKITSSCGCLSVHNKKGKDTSRWTGYECISGRQWQGIKHNANIRNIEFNISIEQSFNKLISQDFKCIYSGEPLYFPETNRMRELKGYGASIDRKNSKEGYSINNIQWVCPIIQNMKFDLSEDSFLGYIFLLENPLDKIDNVDYTIIRGKKYEGYYGISGHYYSRVLYQARKRNIVFDLTKKELWELFENQKGCCNLTGLPIYLNMSVNDEKNTIQTASLDRIDNSLPYIKGNVQWVHKDINTKIKKNLSEDTLHLWSKRVYCYRRLEESYENKCYRAN